MDSELSKFAVVSHILPPSPSGQAMVLRQLLDKISSDKYCLLSRENYEDEPALSSANRYWLKPAPRLPEIGPRLFSAIIAAINVLICLFFRARQIERIIRKEDIKLLIACSGDLYDIPAAALASRWVGIPFVPYFFDDYLYQWVGYNRKLASILERLSFRHVHRAIVPNEYLQQEYLFRYDIACTIIRNPCILSDVKQLDQVKGEFDPDEVAIVYTGAIYHAHYDAFRNMVAAIGGLKRNNVRLHIYTSQPVSELLENGIRGPMVVYHEHIIPTEVPKILRQATILFLPLAFETAIPEVIKTSAPGKAGEYLAVGRPIIVHAPDDSFISWYFRVNNCGVVVGKNDPTLLKAEVARVLDDPELQKSLSIAARQSAEKDFDLESISADFVEFISGNKK